MQIKLLTHIFLTVLLGFVHFGLQAETKIKFPLKDGSYKFNISKHSEGRSLSCMDMQMKTVGEDMYDITLSIKKGDVVKEATFQCSKDEVSFLFQLDCYSPEGHGEFDLLTHGEDFLPRIKVDYLNLGEHAPDVEITQEFNIHHLAKSPNSSVLFGIKGSCAK